MEALWQDSPIDAQPSESIPTRLEKTTVSIAGMGTASTHLSPPSRHSCCALKSGGLQTVSTWAMQAESHWLLQHKGSCAQIEVTHG